MSLGDVSRAQAGRDVALQLAGRVLNLALGAVATVVVVRALGVQDNGRWATLLAVTGIAGALGELGLEPTAVRRAARDPAEEARWLGALLTTRVLAAVPAAAIAAAAGFLVTGSAGVHLAGVLVALTILAAAPQSLRAAFQLQVRNDRSMVVITVGSVLWTAGVLVVAAAGGSVVAFAAALLATTVLTTLVQAVLVRRTASVDLSGARRHGRALLRAGAPLGVAAGLGLAYGRVDQLLVLHYDSARGAGLYGSASLLLERLQVLPAAIMATTLPLLGAAWPQDPARARRLVAHSLEAMAVLSLPVAAFALVAARPAVLTLFGRDFAPAADVLPVLMAAFVLVCAGHVFGFLSIVVERQRAFVGIALAALVVNVAANAVLLPRFGFRAAAWTTVLTELLVVTWAARVVLGTLGWDVRPARLPRIVVAAAAMAGLVAAARAGGAGGAGLLVVAAVTYPAAVLACGAIAPEDRDRVRAVVRRRPGGGPRGGP